jgi:hypothetical protein
MGGNNAMRQYLALVTPALLAGGCSWIYNPSNIKPPDASIDAPPDMKPGPQDAPEMIADANPAAITLTSVEPMSIVEGQGAGGSRRAVLVVHGMNIIAGATIAITPKNGTDTPMVTSMAGGEIIGTDHNFIAVPVTAAVNASCDTGTLPLTVTVTQSGTSATTDWMLTCLPQMNQSTDLMLPTAQPNLFSEIVLTGTAKIVAADTSAALIVRATADIAVAGAIDVSANAQSAGPGGGAGGGASKQGGGAGGGGPGGGLVGGGGGGGAGYHDTGASGTGGAGGPAQGDVPMTNGYAANYASGGGGGDGVGGGGGGTVELTAGGTLATDMITSKGAGGTGATLGSGGGGGAGGTIVLRGASITTTGALSVAAGSGTGGGGNGSVGRIRIDTPMFTGTAPAGAYTGLSIDTMAPLITNSATPTITVHGTPGARYDIFTLDQGNNVKDEDDNKLLGGATGQMAPQVHWGWNKVCVVPHGGSPTTLESASCIEVAFLP